MSTLNTPADTDAMPQTPAPASAYLPSPPITPICKRSATVKVEETTQSNFNIIWQEPSQPIVPPPVQVKRRSSPRSKKSPRVSKQRCKTPATAKLSVRRKLLESHPLPKRKSPATFKPASPATSTSSQLTPRMGKVKIKLEFDPAEIQRNFTINDVPMYTRPRKSVNPVKPRGHVTISKKTPKRPVKPVAKSKTKGRMTNNSLSSTLHPTIIKRKGQKARTYSVGKICSSYYPSNRCLIPHSAGERYHKGKP